MNTLTRTNGSTSPVTRGTPARSANWPGGSPSPAPRPCPAARNACSFTPTEWQCGKARSSVPTRQCRS